MEPCPRRGRHQRQLILGGLALGLLAAAPLALAGLEVEPDSPHSPNVGDAWHEPTPVLRGQEVTVHVRLRADTEVERVVLIYCRAENYACGPSRLMRPQANGTYLETIPWSPKFFQGVEHVGYNFTVHYLNGSKEHSPRFNWPQTPLALPPDAGRYYFYRLEGDVQSVPAPAPLIVLAGLALALWGRRE